MSRSSSINSNAERRFREEMADYDEYDEYDLPGDEYEFDGEQGRIINLDHITLPEEIRLRGTMSGHNNLNDYQYREMENQRRDMERYGSQNNGQYNMENFIVQVLELDMDSDNVRWMDAGERTDYIIDRAVKVINSDKKEIHFTPNENTEYKKIKAIYDKLADDLKKMVCRRIGLSPCPRNSDDVVTRAIKKFPDVSNRIRPGMTFGYKLKVIEDYLENKTRSEAKGRKTRRRVMSKKRPRGRPRGKTKRRRARSKKM